MDSRYVEILAGCLKEVFGEMTGIAVLGVGVNQDGGNTGSLDVAQLIDYQWGEKAYKGQFLTGFPQKETALEVAGHLAEQQGLPRPRRFTALALDLLAEFMNEVTDRTIMAWRREGLAASFGGPSPLQIAQVQTVPGFDLENYQLQINMAFTKMEFQVYFCEEVVESTGSKPKVLVADSSNSLRSMLQKTLNEAGYQVTSVSDGIQAVQMYHRIKPAVVLMDLEIPGMGGMDAIASIVEEDPGAKFVVLASPDRRDEVVTAKTLGALDHITKPLNKNRLLTSVARALGE